RSKLVQPRTRVPPALLSSCTAPVLSLESLSGGENAPPPGGSSETNTPSRPVGGRPTPWPIPGHATVVRPSAARRARGRPPPTRASVASPATRTGSENTGAAARATPGHASASATTAVSFRLAGTTDQTYSER